MDTLFRVLYSNGEVHFRRSPALDLAWFDAEREVQAFGGAWVLEIEPQ